MKTKAGDMTGILAVSFLLWSEAGMMAQMTDVLTFHNDIARTGQALNEQILTPAIVNSNHFGKLWMLPTDDKVLAEPLYVAGVTIPGVGLRNVVFVETENDSAYAFDADSTNLFWRVSLLEPGEEPYQTSFCTIQPQIGITATPVIDRQMGANGAIFIQAMSQDDSGHYYQRLWALDLATGQENVLHTEINATYPGHGENSDGANVIFDPIHYVDRACLLLLNGVVYTAWSSHCDTQPATSWVIGYDEYTLAQANVMNLEPNDALGSIWDSGAGPAADPQGNIYVVMGNGLNFQNPITDANGFPVDQDYDNALVKLSTTSNALAVADYFTEYDVAYENLYDLDLGSAGAVVLPPMIDSHGKSRQLVVVAPKDQNIYLTDSSNLGKFNLYNNNAIYQEVTNIFTGTNQSSPSPNGQGGGVWGVPAYFNGSLYFGPVNGPITAFPFANARLGASTSTSAAIYNYPGATPSVSANGVSNAIVWSIQISGDIYASGVKAAVLHANAATNLAVELYNSVQASNRHDQFGAGQRFVPPMVASARVYVATTNGVAVFGLFDQSVLTPIQQWRNSHFGNPSNVGAGANDASPAGDGVPNLIKYAVGLNPLTAAVQPITQPGIQQCNGQSYLTLTLQRQANPTDVTCVAQISSDLQSWNSGPAYTATITNTATNLVIRDASPIGGSTNSYMRLLFYPNN